MLRTLASKSTLLNFGLKPAGARSITSCSSVRSGEGLKGFAENEKTIEDLYFTKEDQRFLAKIMTKVKEQSDVTDIHAAAGLRAAEQSALKPIIDKYKMSTEDVQKLLAWKHTQY